MLARIPSQEAPKLARGNRRAAVRYRCAPATSGKLTVDREPQHRQAWLLNVSERGVGLILPHPLDPGTYVVLYVRSLDRRRLFTLQAHVIHATHVNQSDWLVGCDLVQPLSADDLDDLL